jgi:hypothetical protein
VDFSLINICYDLFDSNAYDVLLIIHGLYFTFIGKYSGS